MNYKGQRLIHIIHAPSSFEKNLDSLPGEAIIKPEIGDEEEAEFVLIFSTKLEEVTVFAKNHMAKLKGDAVVWICYPKGTSKKFKCDFNRDTCWEALQKMGLEGVRMIAIDEDWSALRMRKEEFVKKKR
ncbi:MAG: hypothetical protein HXX13_13345 [Bacteroidetes bacterium]|nr:hypothetical protein [Bacteroidota bacterium]